MVITCWTQHSGTGIGAGMVGDMYVGAWELRGLGAGILAESILLWRRGGGGGW